MVAGRIRRTVSFRSEELCMCILFNVTVFWNLK